MIFVQCTKLGSWNIWHLQTMVHSIFKKQPPEVFYKIRYSKKFRETPNSIRKETPTQVFSYEFCKSFKNTYFVGHLRMAASDLTSFARKDVGMNQRIDLCVYRKDPSFSLEVATGGILRKTVFLKKIYKRTPVLESVYNKAVERLLLFL